MKPQEIIQKKRDNHRLQASEIEIFVRGIANGQLSEGQIAAFAMAVWFRGMDLDETVALTRAMARSGETLQWADINKPIADKHSTGGIGDNVSLMLAPIIAACDVAVPMISGRGLGHTGGTLDKLESIPGYHVTPDAALFHRVVKDVGCAIIGQTATLAPADGRLYAIRDVTATVDSIPLITASILSKKLAAGLETLILDVKTGSGAFMRSRSEAEALARGLVDVANGAGVKTTAFITDMNEPLADCAGNAIEMRHCMEFLLGQKQNTRIETLVLALAADMLVNAGRVNTPADGEIMARRVWKSGQALEVMGRMIAALGGPRDFIERFDYYLPLAPVIKPIPAHESGWLASCDARMIGMDVIALGGGRLHPADAIDHRVGFSDFQPLGTRLEKGDPIAFVHAVDEASAEKAIQSISANYKIADQPTETSAVILGKVE